jgi:hypothetical protein
MPSVTTAPKFTADPVLFNRGSGDGITIGTAVKTIFAPLFDIVMFPTVYRKLPSLFP